MELAPVPGMLTLVAGDARQLQAPRRFPHMMLPSRPDVRALVLHVLPEDDGLPVLDGIPHGVHSAWYSSRWLDYEHPPRGSEAPRISVDEEVAELFLPVRADFGTVELDLCDFAGEPFEGLVFASVGKRRSGETGGRRGAIEKNGGGTLEPPYLFRGLPAGEWTIQIHIPRITLDSGSRLIDVQVSPGAITRVSRVVSLSSGP